MNIPFTQTKEYLSWHESIGAKTFYLEFFADAENEESVDNQIDGEEKQNLENRKFAIAACVILNLRIGKVLYVPYGPFFYGGPSSVSAEEKNKVFSKLKEIAKKENCVFVRLEENEIGGKSEKKSDDHKHVLEGRKNSFYFFRPSKKTFAKEGIFQPRMEWWLNITPSPSSKEGNSAFNEELFDRIHKDHKYSIRRAERELVQIEIVNLDHKLTENDKEKYFAEFWKLLKETGERDGFSLYEENYYKQIFKHYHASDKESLKKFLVFTKLKVDDSEKYLSVALIVISDKIANLVFAGSVSEGREKGFNHLMQWAAILESKKHGCEIYNFGGITEDGYGKQTLEGVTKFKKKFGGYAKFHGDFLDMPIKKLKYFLYLLRKLF